MAMDWSTLVPVVIGGVLAVGGGALGQALTHTFTASREAKKARAERLERLATAVWAHSTWLDEKMNDVIFRGVEHVGPDPLDEARMLGSLYFPELGTQIAAVMHARMPMIKFIGQQGVDRRASPQTWTDSLSERMKEYHALYETHLDAVHGFTSACRKTFK
ncbi:hypothetical protein A9R05_05640 [Burkholderia sp. KK1]|nr:hypothetical protein A9R05_05640 [Burkholderia sp. KK1]